MEFDLLSRETAEKARQLSIIFNTVISLKADEDGYYTEMYINHYKITISMWSLEHHSLEFLAKTIVELVVANFDLEV